MATPSLSIIQQSEHYQIAEEFFLSARSMERFIFMNDIDSIELIDFTENEIPLLVTRLIAIKSSIKNAMDQLPEDLMRDEVHRYIAFEGSEALKFEKMHNEMMEVIKRGANDHEQSASECVPRLLKVYNDHIDTFHRKLAEIDGHLLLNDDAPSGADVAESTKAMWLKWTCRVTVFIVFALLITVYLPKLMKQFVAYLETQNLDWCLPILLSLVLGCWLSLSPGGSMPSVMCGIVFHDNAWLAVTVSYVSTNIGALLNLAWIRLFIIHHEEQCCVKTVMKLLAVHHLRKRKDLKRLFMIWNPITIIIVLRLPFIGGGTINYLTAFQPEYISVTECIIANAIGFIPGSVLFTLFGNTIEKDIKRFLAIIWNCETWEERLITMQEWRRGIIIFFLILSAVITIFVMLLRYTRRVLKESERRSSDSVSVTI